MFAKRLNCHVIVYIAYEVKVACRTLTSIKYEFIKNA